MKSSRQIVHEDWEKKVWFSAALSEEGSENCARFTSLGVSLVGM